jgi:hypothetical protein
VLSVACATLSWEVNRIESEVSLIAHTGIGIPDLRKPTPTDNVSITEMQRPEMKTDPSSAAIQDSENVFHSWEDNVPGRIVGFHSRRLGRRMLLLSIGLFIVVASYFIPSHSPIRTHPLPSQRPNSHSSWSVR